MTSVCMIYGASGFAGRLILDAALARGLRPVVAGRSEGPVQALADRHGLPSSVFSLTDLAATVEELKGVDVMLNAAGPDPVTAEQLARACIAYGTHYIDIGCSLSVLQRLQALDEAAHAAGTAVVSGVGFSPAVAEALAVQLKRRLPRTVRLTIALCSPARPSPGLIRTGLEIALRPSAALRLGKVRFMRRRRLRRFDFGRGPEPCYRLGWGELAAIHRATGVRNVDFFVRARPDLMRLLRLSPVLAAFRRLPLIGARFESFAAAHGPKPPERPGRSRMVGFAYDADGQRAASRIHLPDPWTVTAQLAAGALTRAVAAPVPAGVHSAGQFLGPDFLAEMPRLYVDWEELELSAPGDLNLRIRRHGPLLRRVASGLFATRTRSPEPQEGGPPSPDASGLTVVCLPPAPSPQTDTEAGSDKPAAGDGEGLRRTG